MFCSFSLIGYNFKLWPISVKMANKEECGWTVVGTQLCQKSQKIPHHAHVCL